MHNTTRKACQHLFCGSQRWGPAPQLQVVCACAALHSCCCSLCLCFLSVHFTSCLCLPGVPCSPSSPGSPGSPTSPCLPGGPGAPAPMWQQDTVYLNLHQAVQQSAATRISRVSPPPAFLTRRPSVATHFKCPSYCAACILRDWRSLTLRSRLTIGSRDARWAWGTCSVVFPVFYMSHTHSGVSVGHAPSCTPACTHCLHNPASLRRTKTYLSCHFRRRHLQIITGRLAAAAIEREFVYGMYAFVTQPAEHVLAPTTGLLHARCPASCKQLATTEPTHRSLPQGQGHLHGSHATTNIHAQHTHMRVSGCCERVVCGGNSVMHVQCCGKLVQSVANAVCGARRSLPGAPGAPGGPAGPTGPRPPGAAEATGELSHNSGTDQCCSAAQHNTH